MKATIFKSGFFAMLGVLDANNKFHNIMLHYMHLEVHTDPYSPDQLFPWSVNVHLVRIEPFDLDVKASESPDDRFLMVFRILPPSTSILPVTPFNDPINALTLCSGAIQGKVIQYIEEGCKRFKIKVSNDNHILPFWSKKSDEITVKPCLICERSGETNGKKNNHVSIIEDYFSMDRSVRRRSNPKDPRELNNIANVLKHVELRDLAPYDIGWALPRSSIEDLKQRKKLTKGSVESMLDLEVLITTTGGIYSITWLITPILYLGDITDVGISQARNEFISEDSLQDVKVEFGGWMHFKQKAEIFLGQTATRIPEEIYNLFTSTLKKRGLTKQGDYYVRGCENPKNYHDNLGLAPIRLSFKDECTLSIEQYVRQEGKTCFVDILPSSDGKWLFGTSFFLSNFIVIDTTEQKRKYKFSKKYL